MVAKTLSIIQYAVIDDLKNFRISTKQIAKRNGVSPPTIYKIAGIAGIDMEERDKKRIEANLRTFGPSPKNERREEILVRLKEGMLTAFEIADTYDVSVTLVGIVAKDNDIKVGHRRILIKRLDTLRQKKEYLESRIASINAELDAKQALLDEGVTP